MTNCNANLFNEPSTCLPASNAEVLVVWNVKSLTRLVVIQQVEHGYSRLHNTQSTWYATRPSMFTIIIQMQLWISAQSDAVSCG